MVGSVDSARVRIDVRGWSGQQLIVALSGGLDVASAADCGAILTEVISTALARPGPNPTGDNGDDGSGDSGNDTGDAADADAAPDRPPVAAMASPSAVVDLCELHVLSAAGLRMLRQVALRAAELGLPLRARVPATGIIRQVVDVAAIADDLHLTTCDGPRIGPVRLHSDARAAAPRTTAD